MAACGRDVPIDGQTRMSATAKGCRTSAQSREAVICQRVRNRLLLAVYCVNASVNFDCYLLGEFGSVRLGHALKTRNTFGKRTGTFSLDRHLLALLADFIGPAENIRRCRVRKRMLVCYVIAIHGHGRNASTARQDQRQKKCAQCHGVKVASADDNER